MTSTLNKIKLLRLLDKKVCSTNCACINRMKTLLQKPSVNIINDAFLKFQMVESIKEYENCYTNKIKSNLTTSASN